MTHVTFEEDVECKCERDGSCSRESSPDDFDMPGEISWWFGRDVEEYLVGVCVVDGLHRLHR